MRFEPLVDASHVEHMPALRKKSDFISRNQLRQANGAVIYRQLPTEWDPRNLLLISVIVIVMVGWRVSEFGERIENLFIQGFVGSRRSSTTSSSSRGLSNPTDPGAAGDGDKAEDTNQGAEESRKDKHEVGIEQLCGMVVGGRG